MNFRIWPLHEIHEKIMELFLCYSEQFSKRKFHPTIIDSLFKHLQVRLLFDVKGEFKCQNQFPFSFSFKIPALWCLRWSGCIIRAPSFLIYIHLILLAQGINVILIYGPVASQMPSVMLWMSSQLVFSDISSTSGQKDDFALDVSPTCIPTVVA